MTESSRFERRVAALVAAYADRAPTDVEPLAVARLAASFNGSAPRFGLARRFDVRRFVAVAALALLIGTLAAAASATLLTGGRPLHRDPLRAQVGDPAVAIAIYERIHEGFVFVYEDGRVLVHPDQQSWVPSGTQKWRNYELWLSARGIDLVRSGQVLAQSFLHEPRLPTDAWADAVWRPYLPTRYAVCGADGLEDILPGEAKQLLLSRKRVYPAAATHVLEVGTLVPADYDGIACSELTIPDARRLLDFLAVAGFETQDRALLDGGSNGGFAEGPDGRTVEFWPIAPHGSWVGWGG
jgi:hypothetical protein